MRQHRFRPGSFPCRVDHHGKRAAGKIQQLRYISDIDAQAAKWDLENHAPDVGRSAEPAAVKYWIASVPRVAFHKRVGSPKPTYGPLGPSDPPGYLGTSRLGELPSEFMTQISPESLELRVNTIRKPSGEKKGTPNPG